MQITAKLWFDDAEYKLETSQQNIDLIEPIQKQNKVSLLDYGFPSYQDMF